MLLEHASSRCVFHLLGTFSPCLYIIQHGLCCFHPLQVAPCGTSVGAMSAISVACASAPAALKGLSAAFSLHDWLAALPLRYVSGQLTSVQSCSTGCYEHAHSTARYKNSLCWFLCMPTLAVPSCFVKHRNIHIILWGLSPELQDPFTHVECT